MAKARGIRAGRAYVELGYEDRVTKGLNRLRRRLEAFGSRIQQIGRRMMFAGAAAAAPFAVAVKAFAGFEYQMARVKALTDASAKEFARLNKKAQLLGETTIFTARQVADAMAFFALAGYDVKKILNAIEPTLAMAAAGQLDVAESADIVAKVSAGMGVAMEDLPYSVDVMTKAFTTAQTDLQMLGEAMSYVGPVAAGAGMAFEEITAAIQILSNAGIQASMAGTTMRMVIRNLTSPTARATELLNKMRISVADVDGNVRPLADILDQLNAAMVGMGTAARLNIIGKLFPARASAGITKLLSGGASQLRDFTAQLYEAGGTAARIASVQLDTLKGSAIILKSAIERLGISIGGTLGPILRQAADRIADVTRAVSGWADKSGGLVLILAAVTAGVVLMGGALFAFGVTLRLIAFSLGAFLGLLRGVGASIRLLTFGLSGVLRPLGIFLKSLLGVGAAFLIFTGRLGRGLSRLLGEFWSWALGVRDIFEKIRALLKSGDQEQAAKILWLGLRVVWLDGKRRLLAIWADMWDSLLMGWKTFATTLLHFVEVGWYSIKSTWISAVAGLSYVWEHALFDIKAAWLTTQNWLSKKMLGFWGWLRKKKEWVKAGFGIGAEEGTIPGLVLRITYARIDRETKEAQRLADEQLEADIAPRWKEHRAKLQKISDKAAKDQEQALRFHLATLDAIWEEHLTREYNPFAAIKRVGVFLKEQIKDIDVLEAPLRRLANVWEDYQRRKAAATGGLGRQMGQAEADALYALGEARIELADALKKAQETVEKAEAERTRRADRRAGVAAREAVAAVDRFERGGAAGVFNPFRAWGLSIQSPLEKGVTAAVESAEHLRVIRREVEEGQRWP